MKRRLVVVETPFAGEVERNVHYTRLCLRDCLINHNEYPFASHLLYTQRGILNDNDEHERNLGMEAGLAWVEFANATIVYDDLGISKGMKFGIERAHVVGREIIYRQLGQDWQSMYENLIKELTNHPFSKEDVRM